MAMGEGSDESMKSGMGDPHRTDCFALGHEEHECEGPSHF